MAQNKVLTLQQKLNLIAKTTKEVKKKAEKEHKEEDKKKEEERKRIKTYPPMISKMLKRARGLKPNGGVCKLNPFDAVIVVYYKFKKEKFDNVRLVNSGNHCWIEFEFSDIWYIFDIFAINHTKYGEPIKDKRDPDNADFYKDLARTYTDINRFMDTFEDKTTFTKDEASIYAQKDSRLNSIFG